MKTITEFPSLSLKNASKVKLELIASGKTPEELPQALGETLKLEGDKLSFLMSALEMVGAKQNDLKRVVVYALNEGEKAPEGTIQKENNTFLVEYYPPMGDKNLARGRQNDAHPGENSKGKRGKGRNDGRGDRKPPQGPQQKAPKANT